jgi:hypothetical protein
MGGYDVFKSIYNPDTKSWSAPMNLGYPINTPYDDFLFVPSDDQSQALIASNRATHDDKLVVYTISFSKTYSYTDLSPNIDFNTRANFKQTPKPVFQNSKKELSHDPAYPAAVSSKKTSGSNEYPAELLQQKDYNEQLNKALQYQLQSDSLGRVSEDLRQKSLTAKNDSEKERLKKDIYSLDARSRAMQQKADEYYEKARAYETNYAERNTNGMPPSKISDDKVRKAFKKSDPDQNKPPAADKKVSKNPEKKTPVVPKTKTGIVYEFKVMAKSPYASIDQIPLNQPLPSDLIYRIQMGAFSKVIEPDRFKGIVPISGETLQNGTVTKYYAGFFNRFTDAEKALSRIKELGFRDSYIVSFFDGKSIPVNRAREIENDK